MAAPGALRVLETRGRVKEVFLISQASLTTWDPRTRPARRVVDRPVSTVWVRYIQESLAYSPRLEATGRCLRPVARMGAWAKAPVGPAGVVAESEVLSPLLACWLFALTEGAALIRALGAGSEGGLAPGSVAVLAAELVVATGGAGVVAAQGEVVRPAQALAWATPATSGTESRTVSATVVVAAMDRFIGAGELLRCPAVVTRASI